MPTNEQAQATRMATPAAGFGVGAVVPPTVRLGQHVEIGPMAVFEDATTGQAPTVVGDRVRVGANATICVGAHLADGCVVRPGAVVTRAVPPGAIVEGNPATIIGYAAAAEGPVSPSHPSDARQPVEQTPVRGVTVHHFPVIPDLRGNLTVGEFDRQIPFRPLRYFMVFGVPRQEIRGEHAHLACHQFLICVRGSCAVVADDGQHRVEVRLDAPNRGVYLPPMTWGIQYKYTEDAVLLVFASHHYDAADYIRNYADFLQQVQRRES